MMDVRVTIKNLSDAARDSQIRANPSDLISRIHGYSYALGYIEGLLARVLEDLPKNKQLEYIHFMEKLTASEK